MTKAEIAMVVIIVLSVCIGLVTLKYKADYCRGKPVADMPGWCLELMGNSK
jgi:hypothetical protein